MCKENMLCKNRLCVNYTIECATLRSLPVLQKKPIPRNDSSDDEEIIPALEPVEPYQQEENAEEIESIGVLVGFEEQIRRITKYLREIKDFGSQPVVTASVTEEKMKALVNRKCLQTIAEIDDLKDDLENVVKDKISTKQMELLGFNDVNEDREVNNADPSVEFFGMECDIVVQKVLKIGTGVRIFKQKLIRSKEVDVLLLSSLLEKIDCVEIEVGLHAKAFAIGRKAVETQDQRTNAKIMQSSNNGPASLSKSQSFKTNNVRSVKYKKNKTDTVYSAQSRPRQTNQNQQKNSTSSGYANGKDNDKTFLYNVALITVEKRLSDMALYGLFYFHPVLNLRICKSGKFIT